MKKIIRVKNKWTNDVAEFEIEKCLTVRAHGLAMESALDECAYQLGCKRDDLIMISK